MVWRQHSRKTPKQSTKKPNAALAGTVLLESPTFCFLGLRGAGKGSPASAAASRLSFFFALSAVRLSCSVIEGEGEQIWINTRPEAEGDAIVECADFSALCPERRICDPHCVSDGFLLRIL